MPLLFGFLRQAGVTSAPTKKQTQNRYKRAESNFAKRAARGGKREEGQPIVGQQQTELLQNTRECTFKV